MSPDELPASVIVFGMVIGRPGMSARDAGSLISQRFVSARFHPITAHGVLSRLARSCLVHCAYKAPGKARSLGRFRATWKGFKVFRAWMYDIPVDAELEEESRQGEARLPFRLVSRCGLGGGMWAAGIFVVVFGAAWAVLPSVAGAAGPDGRGYELVTPVDTDGATPGSAVSSVSGDAVMWQADPFGEARTGGQTLYRARRTPTGWQTAALTPKSVVQSTVLFAQTPPMFFAPELTQVIFASEQPFAAGDRDEGAIDLYEESAEGTLTWVSQGSQGGAAPAEVTYAGATPDGSHVVFNTPESLLPAATGLREGGYGPDEYLYDRDVPAARTDLVDVNNAGALLNVEGAILGNGTFMTSGLPATTVLPANYYGTTTNAISEDGSKIFFEAPPPGAAGYRLTEGGGHAVHLYMRKDANVTVALDDPAVNTGAGARYLGASRNGSYVFFVSDEGLAGEAFRDNELYVYDTEAEKLTAISVAPRGSPTVDGAVYGVSAIANDGSRVYYIARGKLATNTNAMGQSATEGQPNLYVYDTASATNKFVTQLGFAEVETSEKEPGRLDSYLDLERLAVPTPNGDVLVFQSELNLTGQDPNGTPQIYRYDAISEGLLCVSCSLTGTGGSSLAISSGGPGGAIAGGTYDPPGKSAPMSETGDQIFFETENALVGEDQNSSSPPIQIGVGEFKIEVPTDVDVYEWENGHVYLISAGKTGITSLQSVSPSGNDVFFNTSVSLTGQAPSGYIGLYDARVGGGFPTTSSPEPQPCENAEGCRGRFGAPPPPGLPGSAIPEVTSITSLSLVQPAKPKPTKKPPKKQKEHKKSKHKRHKAHKTLKKPVSRGSIRKRRVR